MDINYSDPTNSRFYDIFIDENTNTKYSIMLNQTDITRVRGHNKFTIQLLEHKQRGQYKFICKWGRVGKSTNF